MATPLNLLKSQPSILGHPLRDASAYLGSSAQHWAVPWPVWSQTPTTVSHTSCPCWTILPCECPSSQALAPHTGLLPHVEALLTPLEPLKPLLPPAWMPTLLGRDDLNKINCTKYPSITWQALSLYWVPSFQKGFKFHKGRHHMSILLTSVHISCSIDKFIFRCLCRTRIWAFYAK
jgi:hypothetical protein